MAEPEPRARLGVVVPCRNEAVLVRRKLASLARSSWPRSARPHRLVVVDDGSQDGTAERARAAFEELAADFRNLGVEVLVVANDIRPGKPGAIARGLVALDEAGVDLVVLTDADAVSLPGALVALARAFERDPRLAMASGAQRFVASLADDGGPSGADGLPLEDAASRFDRWTARVRRAESRAGRLFSVHGQLLAWRAALLLRPTFGLAADDLDLMLQVRARGRPPSRVELVPGAVFLEVKTREPEAARAQAERRARAYVQVVRAWDGRTGAFRGLQWSFYRRAPLAAPRLTLAGLALAPALCGAILGWSALPAAAAVLGALCVSPWGRGWIRLMRRIESASRGESRAALSERWEMARR